jgi:hypothetical protein
MIFWFTPPVLWGWLILEMLNPHRSAVIIDLMVERQKRKLGA